MKKEVIVLVLDAKLYLLDIADKSKTVSEYQDQMRIADWLFVSFQTDELISILGDKSDMVSIVDFECLDLQVRQSIGYDEPEGRWSVPNMLKTFLGKEERNWKKEEYEELLRTLGDCYVEIKKKAKGEWARILNIELPVNRILYRLQREGIFVNHKELGPLCQELNKEVYELKNRIQFEFEFVGDDLELFLRKIKKEADFQLLRFQPEYEVFDQIKKAKRNLNCMVMLLALAKDVNCCRPLFKGFGSSTGRIYLRDPALQNLSKQFRHLLINKDLPKDKRYLYVDYGQFEAGVLAGLTKNKGLSDLYDHDCVYESLAKKIGVDRDRAKMIFYCFVYGGIVWKGAKPFFDGLDLGGAVEKVVQDALEKHYVETPLGGRRVCNSKEDKRWVLNHLIQGTSALIFKQALIDVYEKYHEKVDLVLPMHDAALYIVDNSIKTEDILILYQGAFSKWIPDVEAKVRIKDFFKEGERGDVEGVQ